jgi:hypothetical protein
LPPNVTRKDFEFAASELLAEMAGEARLRENLERALQKPLVRRIALDASSLLADRLAAPALAALAANDLEAPFLSEDKLIRLARPSAGVGGQSVVPNIQGLTIATMRVQAFACLNVPQAECRIGQSVHGERHIGVLPHN